MANQSAATPSPAFNPYTQNVTVLDAQQNPLTVSITDVDAYYGYGVRICINYSSQIGASLLLLVVLLLLTRKDKRWSPIFTLNTISLALNTIRNLLQILYFTGPFYESYAYLSGDYSQVPPNQYSISIAGVILTFLLVVCIEGSLVLQIKAVCVTMRQIYKLAVFFFASAVAMTAIGFRFGLAVENSKAITDLSDFTNYQWLAAASNYLTTASICFFSFIFITKLGIALHQRRKLGLRQFGPMQIIFIMGCQTLIIPAIFSILENFTSVPELGSQVLTLTAIFLPLSSMWASASLRDKKSHADVSSGARRKLIGSYTSGSSDGPRSEKVLSPLQFSSAGTHTAKISHSPRTPIGEFHNEDKDVEAGGLHVHVGQSFGVTQEKVDN